MCHKVAFLSKTTKDLVFEPDLILSHVEIGLR